MKILIIEDENAAARRLEKMLKENDPKNEILGITDSIESSVQWLQNNPAPDLILMDIHLADGSSFEIFEHHRISCPVVFTTAYDEYAVKAFRLNAVDYLLKPIKSGELANALEKVKKQLAMPDFSNLLATLRQSEQGKILQRMLIRLGQSFKLVDMEDVAYFYTKDKISFLVTRSTSKRFPIDYPLDRLEKMLNPRQFFRINRQFIIHLAAIRELQPYTKSRVKIELTPPIDMEIIVSTERSAEFKRWLVGDLSGDF